MKRATRGSTLRSIKECLKKEQKVKDLRATIREDNSISRNIKSLSPIKSVAIESPSHIKNFFKIFQNKHHKRNTKGVLKNVIEKRKILTSLLVKMKRESEMASPENLNSFARNIIQNRKHKKTLKSPQNFSSDNLDYNISIIQDDEARQYEVVESKVQTAMKLRRMGFLSARKLKNKLSTSFIENIELIGSEKIFPPLSPHSNFSPEKQSKRHQNTHKRKDVVMDLEPFEVIKKNLAKRKFNLQTLKAFEANNKDIANDMTHFGINKNKLNDLKISKYFECEHDSKSIDCEDCQRNYEKFDLKKNCMQPIRRSRMFSPSSCVTNVREFCQQVLKSRKDKNIRNSNNEDSNLRVNKEIKNRRILNQEELDVKLKNLMIFLH